MSVKEKMTAIADCIRSYTGGTEKLFLDDMPNEIENACGRSYENGHQAGYDAGFDAGEESGKQAEYNRFWDAFQKNGTRTSYDSTFQYQYWTDDVYNPKYDILCNDSNGARQLFIGNIYLTNTKVPIRLTNSRLVYSFQNCIALKTIPLLELNGVTSYTNAFVGCSALENITIAGSVDLSLDMSACTKLTKKSINSIVTALSDAATGQTLTLSQTAVDNAFKEVQEDGTVISGSETNEWLLGCVDFKPNWTISLV